VLPPQLKINFRLCSIESRITSPQIEVAVLDHIGLYMSAIHISQSSQVCFPSGKVAEQARVESFRELPHQLKALGLSINRPTLVMIGGAGEISEEDSKKIHRIFFETLAPIAEKWQATVVDGGTDVGIMRLMGLARTKLNATFPLVGVAPRQLAILPGEVATLSDVAPIEPNHTHFLFTPGDRWGDESACLAEAASLLAGECPSVTVLINGGNIARIDAEMNVAQERSLLVVAGSGRTADWIASAYHGQNNDKRANALIATGLIQLVDLQEASVTLANLIETIFSGALARQ
jgi:hypothetical protein